MYIVESARLPAFSGYIPACTPVPGDSRVYVIHMSLVERSSIVHSAAPLGPVCSSAQVHMWSERCQHSLQVNVGHFAAPTYIHSLAPYLLIQRSAPAHIETTARALRDKVLSTVFAHWGPVTGHIWDDIWSRGSNGPGT